MVISHSLIGVGLKFIRFEGVCIYGEVDAKARSFLLSNKDSFDGSILHFSHMSGETSHFLLTEVFTNCKGMSLTGGECLPPNVLLHPSVLSCRRVELFGRRWGEFGWFKDERYTSSDPLIKSIGDVVAWAHHPQRGGMRYLYMREECLGKEGLGSLLDSSKEAFVKGSDGPQFIIGIVCCERRDELLFSLSNGEGEVLELRADHNPYNYPRDGQSRMDPPSFYWLIRRRGGDEEMEDLDLGWCASKKVPQIIEMLDFYLTRSR